MNRLAPILAVSMMLLAACTGGETPVGTDASDMTHQPTPPGTAGADGTGDVTQAMLDDLVAQAAEETGVSADEIDVIAAEAVTWSDGSLGCPQEGMSYTQALVPGYRVMLEVAGQRIEYHAGRDARFFACEDPQEPADGGSVDR